MKNDGGNKGGGRKGIKEEGGREGGREGWRNDGERKGIKEEGGRREEGVKRRNMRCPRGTSVRQNAAGLEKSTAHFTKCGNMLPPPHANPDANHKSAAPSVIRLWHTNFINCFILLDEPYYVHINPVTIVQCAPSPSHHVYNVHINPLTMCTMCTLTPSPCVHCAPLTLSPCVHCAPLTLSSCVQCAH